MFDLEAIRSVGIQWDKTYFSFPQNLAAYKPKLSSVVNIKHYNEIKYPMYNVVFDKIMMPHPKYFSGMSDYKMVLFHELIHWSGRGGRTNRPYIVLAQALNEDAPKLFPEMSCLEEITAEMGAVILGRLAGIKNFKNSYRYMNYYVQAFTNWMTIDQKFLDGCRNDAEKSVAYLLQHNIIGGLEK